MAQGPDCRGEQRVDLKVFMSDSLLVTLVEMKAMGMFSMSTTSVQLFVSKLLNMRYTTASEAEAVRPACCRTCCLILWKDLDHVVDFRSLELPRRTLNHLSGMESEGCFPVKTQHPASRAIGLSCVGSFQLVCIQSSVSHSQAVNAASSPS